MEGSELICEEARHVLQGHVLGRSRSYVRLFEFLVARSLEGRVPKEIEIAMEVFEKGADFDPAQDSIVRVYAYNLRQKLDRYYSTDGSVRPHRLGVARGEYRIVLTTPSASEAASLNANTESEAPPVDSGPVRRRSLLPAVLICSALLGVAIGFVARRLIDEQSPPQPPGFASSVLWAPFFDDDLPLLVVVGDYYIFGEVDGRGDVVQLVRDFDVNSRHDLEELLMYEPNLQMRYMDLDLTYLPRGVAFAMNDLLPVLYESGKPIRVVATSELGAADLKTHHVIYIGYVSALGTLEDLVFSSSAFMVGMTYDELVERKTGNVLASEAGTHVHRGEYRDYGLLSTFPGPADNQFLIAAGIRDAGMLEVANALSNPTLVRSIERSIPDGAGGTPSFEMLYEVMSLERTNLDSSLVHRGTLAYEEIWGRRQSF